MMFNFFGKHLKANIMNLINIGKEEKNNTTYDFIHIDSILKNATKNATGNYIDNLLKSTKEKLLPWLKKNNKVTEPKYIYIPLTKHEKIDYIKLDSKKLNDTWKKATKNLTNLTEYLYYLNNPTYDFLIGDTPVKIFGTFIQIGADIIPFNTTESYFNKLDIETKEKIYLISMEINAIEIAA